MATVNWIGFLPVAFGVSLIPGANQLLGLRNAYRVGPGKSMIAVSGRLVAFAVMVVLVAVGLGAVLVRSEAVFAAVQWLGVAYLLHLGVHSLWSSWRLPSAGVDPDASGPAARSVWALSREEFLVAAVNPKALLLFAALLPQFVSGPGSVPAGLLAVGAGYLVVELVVALLYAAAGSRLRSIAISARVDRLVQRVTGVCLVGFAAVLGTSQRPV